MKTNLTTLNSYISLKDGRQLGFAEYGFNKGFPLLFFHGLPGSRLEAGKLHAAALRLQLRLIGLDRPGMGLSSPQKNRTLLDWPNDIKEFATTLNLKNFSIVGHSGGAPYIAACAYRIPELLHKAVIISGIAPLTYPEAITSLSKSQKQMNWMIRYTPMLMKLMMKLSCKALENPKRLNSILKQLPEADAKIFENNHYKESMILSIKEAFRQNASGVVDDFKLLPRPWGFDLEAIRCPFVIWQGGKDLQAPVKHAEIFAQQVPQANYVFLPEEGHISILHNYSEQLLTSAL
ncbi:MULTISPECIES: alpha/beta fold hydrolase [Legionella]|uniref:Tropinesterase n=1 Tax=Legionella drozanskii LLAP-1 TaxID=1212489 RepID=A0A0W0TC78_9GAMM|nr:MULTISPECIES: alpha/beta hydrolase [Legionella]KTC92853.1 Tropinesterase [Legionella drozanskii LLAP-1]PJE05715.1 MAG: alpha/beta hydrolase [Legionella sp.]